MRDMAISGRSGYSRPNRAQPATLAIFGCVACLGLLDAPAFAGEGDLQAVFYSGGEAGLGEPVSLEDLDSERARYAVPVEGPTDVRGFAVILMDELGDKTVNGGTVSAGSGNGTVSVGGSHTN